MKIHLIEGIQGNDCFEILYDAFHAVVRGGGGFQYAADNGALDPVIKFGSIRHFTNLVLNVVAQYSPRPGERQAFRTICPFFDKALGHLECYAEDYGGKLSNIPFWKRDMMPLNEFINDMRNTILDHETELEAIDRYFERMNDGAPPVKESRKVGRAPIEIHLMESAQGDLYGWEGDLIGPKEYFTQLVPSLEAELKRSPKEVHINKAKDLILIDNSVYPVGYEVAKQDAMKHGWHATVEWDDDRHQSIHLRTYLNGELHKTVPIYVSGYRSSAAAEKVAYYLR